MRKVAVFTRTDILLVTSEEFVKATMTPKELTKREANGDMYCFNKNSNEEKSVLFDALITTPRSVYCCRKCGTLSIALEVLFT